MWNLIFIDIFIIAQINKSKLLPSSRDKYCMLLYFCYIQTIFHLCGILSNSSATARKYFKYYVMGICKTDFKD